MKRSLLRGMLLILSAALVLCGILSSLIFDFRLTDEKTAELERLVQAVSAQFDPRQDNDAQAKEFGRALAGVRVTIIAPDGTVTGDSAVDYATLENHADREEIRRASSSHSAVTVRQSSTLGSQMMYAALRTQDGYYIRLAEEYTGLAADLVSFLPAVLAAALVAFLCALFFASRLSSSIAGPIVAMNESLMGIKDGSTTLDPDAYPYEELRTMAAKINSLAADVSRHIASLQDERDKISFILDNMSEGFILLDAQKNILLVNHSACHYLNCGSDLVGRHALYLSRDAAFLDAVTAALSSGQPGRLDLELDGKILETRLTPVARRQGNLDGALIVTLTDVTDNRNAVQTRRDFFSNASHELKTPITSIQGCAELLCSDIPLSEDQKKELLGRIGMETERMSTLIGDIIMINRLESGDVVTEQGPVEFEPVVLECCREIAPFAERSGLELSVQTQPALLMANTRNLHELVGNLLMNAVKYNRPGGGVDVRLQVHASQAVLTVRNDGDPIPPEHQARVFERFYRVDKGRSKTAGGTGLGLSIVKHVVDSLGGSIRLTSNASRGTTFMVFLPCLSREGADGSKK